MRDITLYSDGRGKRELRQLAQRLDAMGRKLEPEIAKVIRKNVVPDIRRDVKISAATMLPRRGGPAARAAKSVRTVTAGSSRKGTVVIRTRNFDRRGLVDKGVLRHPVFARADRTRREWTWVEQSVTLGWWSRAVDQNRDDIFKAANDAVKAIIKSI